MENQDLDKVKEQIKSIRTHPRRRVEQKLIEIVSTNGPKEMPDLNAREYLALIYGAIQRVDKDLAPVKCVELGIDWANNCPNPRVAIDQLLDLLFPPGKLPRPTKTSLEVLTRDQARVVIEDYLKQETLRCNEDHVEVAAGLYSDICLEKGMTPMEIFTLVLRDCLTAGPDGLIMYIEVILDQLTFKKSNELPETKSDIQT